MKIAFDGKRLFHNHTGLGNYSRTLVKDLVDYYPQYSVSLFASNTLKSRFLDDFNDDFKIVDPSPKVSSLWRSHYICKDINNINPDIYHGLSNEIPFSSNKIKSRKIVTIHDLFYIKFPKDFTLIDREIYKRKAIMSCQKADHIVAISHSTKQDIIEILGVKPEKISVIYQSCNRAFQKKGKKITISNNNQFAKLPLEFALYVGSLNKRKNIKGLIKALSLIPKEQRIPLVIVGSGSKIFTKEIQNLIIKNKLRNEIFLFGNSSIEGLQYLYQNARFTCLLSFYEGFGIPIIESLFCNTPVLVGNNSALVEAAGNCGIKCNSFEIEAISFAIQKLTSDSSLVSNFQLNIPDHVNKFLSRKTATNLHLLYISNKS